MIAEHFISQLGVYGIATSGTDAFYSHKPDAPNDLVVAFDESAPSPDEAQGQKVDEFGLQVLSRADAYADARDLLVSIHNNMLGFSGQLGAAGPDVVFFQQVTPPSSIGRDDKDRFECSAHYVVRVTSTGDRFRS